MYNASAEFHTAVRNGNHQMPLLIFENAVFTERDIDINDGIEFDDNFNMEEDIAIGQATSNEIRFTLFNDDRLLNDFEFGEFVATIGVHVSSDRYPQYAPVVVNTNYAQYYGYETPPFIRRNGVALPAQPSFAVKSMLGYNGKVWAFSDDGRYVVYNDATGENITASSPVNAFMRKKSEQWIGKGYFYNPDTRKLAIYDAGDRYWYEFVPLGTFIAERPNVPDQIRINMTCYDRMTKFDKDLPDMERLNISFPCTIELLFIRLCQYVGVPYRTSDFINHTSIIEKKPDDFDSVTIRQVLMWIAEAAGSNARFNRDGLLVFDWLKQTAQSYGENDYTDFQPTWYETPVIDKLYNRNTFSGTDATVGTGTTGYLIQDNPLLK